MKRHSDSTLMHMTKAELIEYVRIAEHNQDVADADLRQLEENLKYWEPVRHGHWIEWAEFFGRETDKKNLGVFCSRCRLYADNGFDYCPNCGAKMDKGE